MNTYIFIIFIYYYYYNNNIKLKHKKEEAQITSENAQYICKLAKVRTTPMLHSNEHDLVKIN